MKLQTDICQAVANSIGQYIKTASSHLLVAVSGGVDSMVLLAVLNQLVAYNLKLTAVHLDHMYRADAAIDDARLVAEYCKTLGITCHIYRRPIEKMANAVGNGFEEMARTVRYRLFKALQLSIKADYIVTAHHLDDLAESVLLHLLRGTGIDGLVGMRSYDGILLRPLLAIKKDQIVAFAEAYMVPYNSDLSNDDTAFLRNKIRHQLIPQLTQDYNQSLVEQLAQLSDIVQHESDYLAVDSKLFFDEVVDCNKAIILNRTLFRAAHIARRRRLIRYLYQVFVGSLKDLSYQHIDLLDSWLVAGKVNSQQRLLGLDFFIDRDGVHIKAETLQPVQNMVRELQVGINRFPEFALSITLSAVPLNKLTPKTICLNLPEQFSGSPLLLRNRQAGDFIRLRGLKGKKKTIKKFFNEQAVPISRRNNLPLLACCNEVLWVKGLRPSIYQNCKTETAQGAYYLYIELIE